MTPPRTRSRVPSRRNNALNVVVEHQLVPRANKSEQNRQTASAIRQLIFAVPSLYRRWARQLPNEFMIRANIGGHFIRLFRNARIVNRRGGNITFRFPRGHVFAGGNYTWHRNGGHLTGPKAHIITGGRPIPKPFN